MCLPTVVAIPWNSGIVTNCTPTNGVGLSVESFGFADKIAFNSASANTAAFLKFSFA